MLSLFDTSRLGEGGQGQSGNYPPLGLDWSVTTQDPSSTPTGLTQNLGHPPRMAVSPPTAWLQSDYSRSAKRLQTPMSRLLSPPSSFAFFLSSLFSFLPGSLGSSLPLFGHTGWEEGGPCPTKLPSLVWGWMLLPCKDLLVWSP